MRKALFPLFVVLAACGGDDTSGTFDAGSPKDASADAPSPFDAGNDASLDAGNDASTCQPTILLAGGTDVAAQGWSIAQQSPASITYGADYVQLSTSTPTGATTGGQLLLYRTGAVDPAKPFKLRFELQVVSVSKHNPLDSAAAIMGSLTSQVGNSTDRAEMIYLDSNQIGWGDDSPPTFTTTVTDSNYHTYVLSVDATKNAQVTFDGTAALTRTNYTTNGTIAVGDQTNDRGVDGTLRIRSVSLLCP